MILAGTIPVVGMRSARGENAVMRKSFAEVLKDLRAAKGWSGERLAEEAGLSQGLISKYETGDRVPRKPTILKLADALKVSPESLLSSAGFATDTNEDDRRLVLSTGDVFIPSEDFPDTDPEASRIALEAFIASLRASQRARAEREQPSSPTVGVERGN